MTSTVEFKKIKKIKKEQNLEKNKLRKLRKEQNFEKIN